MIAALIASLASIVFPTTPALAATLEVTLLTDTGGDAGTPGDLRWAFNQVNAGGGGDTITITATGTLALTRALPSLVKSASIVGSGADRLTLSGESLVRILRVAGPAVTIEGVRFANGSADFGGAIHVDAGASLTVSNSVFTGNAATQGGGAIVNYGALTVRSSEFTENQSDGNTTQGGGGAILARGLWRVENSTFTGNRGIGGGTSGGAITSCAGGVSELVNSTVIYNSAVSGGGVYSACSATAIVHLQNSIVAGNTQSVPSPLYSPDIAGDVTADNSLIGAASSRGVPEGSGNIIGAPSLLGPLGRYGGPTQTVPLLPGSPAIGSGAAAPGVPSVDQRGIARSGRIDIGAFQTQGFTLTKTAGDNQRMNPSLAFAPLVVTVASIGSGGAEPVAGGQILFTAPATGASIATPTATSAIASDATASISPVANGQPGGPYLVTASAGAESTTAFSLTNTRAQTDLMAIATNDVDGVVELGRSFAWTVAVSNVGVQPITFPAGSRILVDDLPSPPAYGAPTVIEQAGASGSGSIACSLADGAVTCVAAGGPVVLAPGGGGAFTVRITVTPTTVGPYVNPNSPGQCMTDPDGVIAEPNATQNNRCTDSVTVVAPELAALKLSNVGNTIPNGFPFLWSIFVTNTGALPAVFTDGQRILVDDLPDSGATYGAPTLSIESGVTNGAGIVCEIVEFRLTCSASGASVTLASGARFSARIPVTQTQPGTLVNPRAGGVCAIDPDGLFVEGNESNNLCANTVRTRQPDLAVSLSTGQPGTIAAGDDFNWFLRIANEGDATATLAAGQRIMFANLPTELGWNSGAFLVNINGVTNPERISCGVDLSTKDLQCRVTGLPATMPPGASFEVLVSPISIPAQPGSYTLPRAGGVCSADPDGLIAELVESNNSCSDTVNTVFPSDLQSTLSNDVAGSASIGASWTWTLAVRNLGPGSATFAAGERIVEDLLPAGATYGTPVVAGPVGVGGTGSIQCGETSGLVECRAVGGSVVLAADGQFQVRIPTRGTTVGALFNPSVNGRCKVDPDDVVPVEGRYADNESKNGNNRCADSVTVTAVPPGTIRIVTDTVPNAADDFTFDTGLTPSTFTLDDDADPTRSNTQVFANVAPGTYSITSQQVPGYVLTGIVCVDTGAVASSGSVATRTATIGLESEEDVTCTFTHESTPSVTIDQAVAQSDPTNRSPVRFAVVFSEPVTNFTGSDVTLSGTAGATTAVVSGGPTAFTVDVSGMVREGTVVAGIGAGVATRSGGVATNSASTSNDDTVRFDPTSPTVTINQSSAQPDPTSSDTATFTVEFSEPVTGFTGADVTLAGTAGATAAVVSGGPTTYTVTVTGIPGNGTVIASIAAGTAVDTAGNTNVASTSTDATVTRDSSAPTVTVNQAATQVDPARTGPIRFTVVFSEPVTGLEPADFTVSGTAGATTASVTGGPAVYSVDVSGMIGEGTVILALGAGTVTDSAGNSNTASSSTDRVVTYDAVAPTVALTQASGQADPTNDDVIEFEVVFSEVVTGFGADDLTLAGSAGVTTATVSVAGAGTTYSVAVSGIVGEGTVILALAAGAATDSAGNPSEPSTSDDDTVTYDASAPTVTIGRAADQADPATVGPLVFEVVFSEPVSGFAGDDLAVTGIAGAAVSEVTGSGTHFTVSVTGMTADGTLVASVAAGAATDASGNASVASEPPGASITYDATAPTVTIDVASAQANPSNGSTVVFEVVFSEPVAGFGADDVTLGGTAEPTSVTVDGGPVRYLVTVSGMTGDGTVAISIRSGVVADNVGHPNLESASTTNIVELDRTPPSISAPRGPITVDNDRGANGAVATFTVTSSDDDSARPAQRSATLTEALDSSGVTCSPSSGSFFPIGTTTVTCTASDLAGNTARASFDVVVVDGERPQIEPPANVTLRVTAAEPTVVVYATPTATDNSGSAPVTCVPPSGSLFPVGTTIVTCTTVDASGNTSSTSFAVTVASGAPQVDPPAQTPGPSAAPDAPAPMPTVDPIAGALPSTGSAASRTLTHATVVILAGVFIFAVARRRRTATQAPAPDSLQGGPT
jgi:hypothetical protein